MTSETQLDAGSKRLLREAYRHFCGLSVAANSVLPKAHPIAVNYGGARSGDVGGPLVKVSRLREHFPEVRWGYNLIYLLSNAPYLPPYAFSLLKRRGVPIVYNQNGVFYPAWFAGDWRGENARMALAYRAADHVFYQSEYCRRCAERFLGPRTGAGEVLYNAIDTQRFAPRRGDRAPGPFTFLITGKIGNHLFYRLESTIRGLAFARKNGLDAKLTVAGWVEDGARARTEKLIVDQGLSRDVSFTGSFTQAEAPAIYRAADAYVMLKHQDPCPNTVLEALACGLPVLYSATGGVPELVGDDAGIGLHCGESFEEQLVPEVQDIGSGMLEIASRAETFTRAARIRAVERFDISHWITRHREVFEALLTA